MSSSKEGDLSDLFEGNFLLSGLF